MKFISVSIPKGMDLTGIKGMKGIRKIGTACPACPEPVEGSVVEGSFRKSCQRHGYPESILN